MQKSCERLIVKVSVPWAVAIACVRPIHKAFEHTAECNPGYFLLLTGNRVTPSQICLGPHMFVYYTKNEKEMLPEIQKLYKMENFPYYIALAILFSRRESEWYGVCLALAWYWTFGNAMRNFNMWRIWHLHSSPEIMHILLLIEGLLLRVVGLPCKYRGERAGKGGSDVEVGLESLDNDGGEDLRESITNSDEGTGNVFDKSHQHICSCSLGLII